MWQLTARLLLPRRYLESQTSSSRKAQLGSSIAIGAGTSIGDDCSISRCVIGRGCVIGKGCNLHGCYLQVRAELRVGVCGCVLTHQVCGVQRHTVEQLCEV